MRSVNQKVLVRVNLSQKDYMEVGGTVIKTALNFDFNYRRRSPVVGQFAESNKLFKEGDLAIFHHNHFYPPSPYFIQDDLFSVPMTKAIFGVLDSNGEMTPVMRNMAVSLIPVPSLMELPPDLQTTYINRYKIEDAGWTTYKKGQIIFTRPNSGYEIVYTWNNIEKRIIKISEDMVCGVVK